jgi:hypothetical protein
MSLPFLRIAALTLLFFAPLATFGDLPRRTSAILSMRATKAGVDRLDRLWAFDATAATVTIVTAEGDATTSGVLPRAMTVDVDPEWGIASLAQDGETIRVSRWDGTTTREMKLTDVATDITWLDATSVAVTPAFAGHRIEIWDVKQRVRTVTMGRALPISRGQGASLARTTLLRFDPRRSEFIALDATFGRIYSFARDGRPLREVKLHASPSAIGEWLSDHDSPAAPLSIRYYTSLAVAADGTIWVSCDPSPGVDRAVYRVALDGSLSKVSVEAPRCALQRLQVWREQLLLLGDPVLGDRTCTTIVPMNPHERLRVSVHQPELKRRPPAFGLEPNASAPCESDTVPPGGILNWRSPEACARCDSDRYLLEKCGCCNVANYHLNVHCHSVYIDGQWEYFVTCVWTAK